MTIASIFIFGVIVCAMVILHEIGHFLACKIFGIPVDEFGFGLPPRMFQIGEWKGTKVTLNWLPLGGFVRPRGDLNPSIEGGLGAAHPLKRIGVFLGGPLMNLLLGFILYTVMISQIGNPVPKTVQIVTVSKGSPAESSGIKPGDLIVKVGNVDIVQMGDLFTPVDSNKGKSISIVLNRAGNEIKVEATPRVTPPTGEGPLGIVMKMDFQPIPFYMAIGDGATSTFEHIRQVAIYPYLLITQKNAGSVVGITGMFRLYQDAVQADGTARNQETPAIALLSYITAITISLGVLNLYPIPALDGGRILFSLPELIFKKQIPVHIERSIQAVFFMLLIIIMVCINISELVL